MNSVYGTVVVSRGVGAGKMATSGDKNAKVDVVDRQNRQQ